MQEVLILAVLLLLGLGAWWSMVLFPRQRDFQKRQRFVRSLAEGDEVITAGGLVGRVTDLQGGVAWVELAQGIRVRIIASSLLAPFDPEELARQSRSSAGEATESSS
ncbi:MAG: preprotein translocase subunit YajC [Anaerolineaceae bacterium]|nr:preprotein translocase subunit YajC [Anaerolineaceae bacterium]